MKNILTLPTATDNKKRVALYLRVSTDDQADNGHGLEVQEEILRKHCSNPHSLYVLDEKHVYRDGGYSGSLSIDRRPALKNLFEAAKNREFDVVLVYRLDRFFRSLKQVLGAVELLSDYKVAFKSATEQFETETTNGQLMFHIIASFAEHERKLIAERMKGGREKVASEGKWVTGVPPYGYRVDKATKMLVEFPEESEIVRKFYDWLVYEKCSLTEICKRANEMGLPSPKLVISKTRKTPRKRPIRTNNFWWKKTVNRILVNEVYTGDFYYRKYKRPFMYLDAVLDEKHQRPESDRIRLNVPAVISKELFQAAIKQLQKNREDSKRNTKRSYLFAKILYCGDSGLKLQSGYQTPRVYKKSTILGKYYHTYVAESRPE